MNDATLAILRELDGARAELRAAWDETPEADRSVRPTPDRWSPVETLEHLSVALHQVVRLVGHLWISAGRAGPARPADFDPVTRVLARRVARPTERVDSPESTRPTGGIPADRIWECLDADLSRLKELTVEMDPFDLRQVHFPHAVLGPLDPHEWAVFAAEHERRHSRQIRDPRGLVVDSGGADRQETFTMDRES